MVTAIQRNCRNMRCIEIILTVFKSSSPSSLVSALKQPNGQHLDKQYTLSESDSLLTDLLANLRHFARHHRHQCGYQFLWEAPHTDRGMSPELDAFVDALREFADERDLCWESTVEMSLLHYEMEVNDEIEDS